MWRLLAAGAGITLALFGLGYLAALADLSELSYVLYWQGWVLGMLAACPGEPCEVRFIHIAAFYAGLPLGVVVYAGLLYGLQTLMRHRQAGRSA